MLFTQRFLRNPAEEDSYIFGPYQVAWPGPREYLEVHGQQAQVTRKQLLDSNSQYESQVVDRHFVNTSRKWSYLSVLIAGCFCCRSFAHAIKLEIACQQCKCQRFACAKLRQKKFLSFPDAWFVVQTWYKPEKFLSFPDAWVGSSWPTGTGHAETRVPQSTMRACPT